MKLIIKEYLASLRERDELDAILPDLLSQMGLEVFIRPSRGHKEYGVDVAAVGKIEDDIERVYLFSVKAGNLDDRDWDGDSNQALRQSLNAIRDVFIPVHMPVEHSGKPVIICSCYGGELKRSISANVSQYEKSNTTKDISYSRWDGEKLSNFIENYFLKEDFLPKEFRELMRKSLALLDEPESSYNFFSQLIPLILTRKNQPKGDLQSLRQLNICLWILYSWCREQDNIESAYMCSELAVLHAWEYAKRYRESKKKINISIFESLLSINSLYKRIANELIREKILKHTDGLHALSAGINSNNPVDINLKLFDLLGRIALLGLWDLWLINMMSEEEQKNSYKEIADYRQKLISIIANNPLLFTPYKDDQTTDIALASWFLSITGEDTTDLKNWLTNIVSNTHNLFLQQGRYPCHIDSYHELIRHPKAGDKNYLEKVTAGSTLYPYISIISAIHGFDEVYEEVKSVKENFLSHSNFQVWYANKSTEDRLYTNSDLHGLTLSDVPVDKPSKEYLNAIFKECDHFNFFEEISTANSWPIFLTACRHYRIPVPVDFFYDLHKNRHSESKI